MYKRQALHLYLGHLAKLDHDRTTIYAQRFGNSPQTWRNQHKTLPMYIGFPLKFCVKATHRTAVIFSWNLSKYANAMQDGNFFHN